MARRPGRVLRVGAAVLLGIGVTTLAVTELTGADAPAVGTDPLSLPEALRAIAANDGLPETVVPSEGSGIELLSVERHVDKDAEAAGTRLADVYTYDYRVDRLYHSVVDLTAGRVVSAESAQDVQLSLSEAEQGRAVRLAFDDAPTRALFDDAYRRVTGAELTDPDGQLQTFSLIYRADANPGKNLGPASVCGRQRCAQLLVNTPDDVLIDVSPVVNLSTGVVYRDLTTVGG